MSVATPLRGVLAVLLTRDRTRHGRELLLHDEMDLVRVGKRAPRVLCAPWILFIVTRPVRGRANGATRDFVDLVPVV